MSFRIFSVLLQLYNTLVLPYLNYCNMMTTAASETLLNKQKRLFELLISLLGEPHTDPLFNKFQLKQIRQFQILGFMYKFTDGLLPPGFNDYFCRQSDIHTYNTRTASRSALGISFTRTNRRKKSLKILGSFCGMIYR